MLLDSRVFLFTIYRRLARYSARSAQKLFTIFWYVGIENNTGWDFRDLAVRLPHASYLFSPFIKQLNRRVLIFFGRHRL
jgi:hypothetical protein